MIGLWFFCVKSISLSEFNSFVRVNCDVVVDWIEIENNMNLFVVLSGVGLWILFNKIINEELVESYNVWVDVYNVEYDVDIVVGKLDVKFYFSVEFIEKVLGIKSWYIYCKDGVLDI